jgi:choice-of-anchor B domain-containing protein
MKQLILSSIILFTSLFSFGQLNMEMLGSLEYSQDLSDIWGYVDEDGNEYALVGVYNGLSIVDITDPVTPAEVFFGEGPGSIWRDIKTWGDYAYVSNETSGGVYIVDLSPLPSGEITTTANFSGSDYPFSSIHNLYIDEFGKLYIFGADNGAGGAIICDLTTDPMNPVELGRFNDFYLHDGMARGDTLWGGGIYQGVLAAIDVSDPSATVIMGTVSTPSQFTHNAWVSADGSHVYTTDEVSSGFIGAYDVTDLSNIIETDRIQSNPGSGVIPHNVHVLNDYLITSYYSDGVTVHDASNPNNLFEVANYDTSPNYSGNGYNGSWGAYPFLPSGNIIASDIQEGLVIMSIEYLRAAFVEGSVLDSLTGDPLFNVNVDVLGTELNTQTAFDGTFDLGTTISGTYDIEFSKTDYVTKVIEDVEIVNGQITELNVDLGMPVISSIADNKMVDRFNLFPNPFDGEITLDFQMGRETQDSKVLLFDTMGKQVLVEQLIDTEGKISFGSNLKPGVYIVKMMVEGQIQETKRIIKL